MAVTAEQKKAIVAEYGKNDKDSGSPEAQIAIFSKRINDLTEHLKTHNKDYSTRRGLMKLVGRRRRLLNYLKQHREPDYYRNLLSQLNLRK